MSTSFGELDAIPGVWQLAGANGSGVCFGVNRINDQRHRDHTVTAIDGFKSGGLSTGFGELNAIPCVGQLAGADSLFIGNIIYRIHRQVIIHRAVTACCQSIGVTDETTLCIGAVVPYELCAHGGIQCHIITRIHLQIPYNDTVATVRSSQGIGISSGFSQCAAIEIDTATITDLHIQTGNRRNMLYNLIQVEALLE